MGTDATKKYGHVAIVTEVNDKDGTITVLESNVGTGLRYKKYKQSNVYGYFDPSKESGITTGSSTSDEKRDYS
jgi:surface antigen